MGALRKARKSAAGSQPVEQDDATVPELPPDDAAPSIASADAAPPLSNAPDESAIPDLPPDAAEEADTDERRFISSLIADLGGPELSGSPAANKSPLAGADARGQQSTSAPRGLGGMRSGGAPASVSESVTPDATSTEDASLAQPPRQPGHVGGGTAVGGVISEMASLIAAPVTLPLAAGSRVWQYLSNRYGAKPAAAANKDAFSVLTNQFDEACNRAIDKISHIRSGPMNAQLAEMVANPLKLDEQFERMAVDRSGEFHERGKRLKQALADPEVRSQYAELRDALDQVQYRGQRMAEVANDEGHGVEDLIVPRLSQISREAEGLPEIGEDGKLKQISDAMADLMERIQEFLRSLFKTQSPAAA